MIAWLKRLFSEEKPQTVGEAISKYRDLVVSYPLSILDVTMLPASKTKMKALLKALYAQAKNADQRNFCKTGFIFLSNFQDGVGAKPVDGKLLSGDVKANLAANKAILEKWLLWEKLSLAEVDVLEAEWKRFMTGEPI